MGGKNEFAPFVFAQFNTEKTEMGYSFLTAKKKQIRLALMGWWWWCGLTATREQAVWARP